MYFEIYFKHSLHNYCYFATIQETFSIVLARCAKTSDIRRLFTTKAMLCDGLHVLQVETNVTDTKH